MAVREIKMIPDKVGVVGLSLLSLRISIEMSNSHGVGVQSPQRNIFLFQGTVGCFFALVSAHNKLPPFDRARDNTSPHHYYYSLYSLNTDEMVMPASSTFVQQS